MNKLESEILEQCGGLEWEQFALYYFSYLPKETQEIIKDMSLKEFQEWKFKQAVKNLTQKPT